MKEIFSERNEYVGINHAADGLESRAVSCILYISSIPHQESASNQTHYHGYSALLNLHIRHSLEFRFWLSELRFSLYHMFTRFQGKVQTDVRIIQEKVYFIQVFT